MGKLPNIWDSFLLVIDQKLPQNHSVFHHQYHIHLTFLLRFELIEPQIKDSLVYSNIQYLSTYTREKLWWGKKMTQLLREYSLLNTLQLAGFSTKRV